MAAVIPFIIAATSTAAAGYGVYKTVKSSQQQKKPSQQAATQATAQTQQAVKEVQQAPKVAAEQAQEAITQKARRRTKTIFTSPLGLSSTAQYARKTLLGH